MFLATRSMETTPIPILPRKLFQRSSAMKSMSRWFGVRSPDISRPKPNRRWTSGPLNRPRRIRIWYLALRLDAGAKIRICGKKWMQFSRRTATRWTLFWPNITFREWLRRRIGRGGMTIEHENKRHLVDGADLLVAVRMRTRETRIPRARFKHRFRQRRADDEFSARREQSANELRQ